MPNIHQVHPRTRLPAHGVRSRAAIKWPWLALALLLMLLLMLLPLLSAGVRAAPPALVIASEPLTAACRAPGASVVIDGPSLLRSATSGTGGDMLFQARMNSGDWSGHLERYAVVADAAGVTTSAMPAWDAGAILTGSTERPPMPAPADRKIYTAIVQADGSLVMTPFAWTALSPAQRLMLDRPPASASAKADGLGEQRVAYLRGMRDGEGGTFRRRSSVLGDAVNSTPVFVGAPGSGPGAAVLTGLNAPAATGYAVFYRRNWARRSMVYLGANDGMLHAFDAGTGSEIFAYVPDALMFRLNSLPDPAYRHQAFVDGPAGAAEALLGGQWKSVLVSAMGGGAQGVFALDVSDPDHFAEGGGALWEFTDRDDPMMGNVLGMPQIARVHTGVAGDGGDSMPGYRYFALVASGLNNYADDGHRSSAGNGALFLLALDKPASAGWKLNVNYYRLVTPIADPTLANALGAPALVADKDGVLRYAYAGDLQGNLWRFDLGGRAPWSGAVGPGPGRTPLFVARDASGVRQPITQQPNVVYASDGGYLVLFGTGRMIEQADRSAASFAQQSYYAIHDSVSDPPEVVGSRLELTRRVLSGPADAARLSISGGGIATGSKGWYVDFVNSAVTGERSVASGTLAGGALVFNTLLPGASTCAAARGRSYVFDVLSGLADERMVAAVAAGGLDGMPASTLVGALQASYVPAPAALMLPADRSGPFDPALQPRVQRIFQIFNGAVHGAAAPPVQGRLTSLQRAGRLSWREVSNWRELHDAAKR